ncbi:isochorismatase family protein [Halosimplex halobium]|uniref:isochorismatase family protein n=1 Tax=Halosimplex halobium TaxID=3396618 RepID=UPI003F5502C6
MGSTPVADAYVPDHVSDDDLAYFEKGGMGDEVGWGDNPAVVVVDMTDAFVDGEYATGRTDTGQAAVEANERLLDAARAAELPVFYTTPTSAGVYPEDYRSSGDDDEMSEEYRKILTEGNVISDPIAPEPDDVVIEKPAPSAFFDTHLANLLHHYDIDTLIVTGMTTSGCVRATVVDGDSSGFRVVVPIECAADRSISSHEMSLFDMDMKYADVRPLDTVLERIDEVVETETATTA